MFHDSISFAKNFYSFCLHFTKPIFKPSHGDDVLGKKEKGDSRTVVDFMGKEKEGSKGNNMFGWLVGKSNDDAKLFF